MTQMRTTPEMGPETQGQSSGSGWRSILGWVLGIVGGIGLVLGGFILFAGAETSIGIGGDLSWRVGDLGPVWGIGLVVAGAIVLLIGVVLVAAGMREPRVKTADTSLHDLRVHAVAYLLVNAFVWIQDYVLGGGIEYAYAVTIPWGVGLVAHMLAYYLSHHSQRPGTPQLR